MDAELVDAMDKTKEETMKIGGGLLTASPTPEMVRHMIREALAEERRKEEEQMLRELAEAGSKYLGSGQVSRLPDMHYLSSEHEIAKLHIALEVVKETNKKGSVDRLGMELYHDVVTYLRRQFMGKVDNEAGGVESNTKAK